MESENQEFELTNEENSKILELLEHPWRLLKEGGKFGIDGVKKMFTHAFLFGFTNFFLFLYAIYRFFASELSVPHAGYILLVLAIGVGITAYAIYRTYNYLIINTLGALYANSSSFFQKIVAGIIDKVDGLIDGTKEVTDAQLQKAISLGNMVNEKYAKMPGLFRKGMNLLLNRIPIVSMVMEIKGDLKTGDKAGASIKLYTKMDNFVTESIFGSNNTNWVWWLLPLNVVISLIIIRWKIG